MAKGLVIVESPAKARTISGYLGDDYTVGSSVGEPDSNGCRGQSGFTVAAVRAAKPM